MTYKEFYNIFKDYFTEWEISSLQELAFSNYEDAHGYRPMKKWQKQIAYDFLCDFLYNMDKKECIEYFNPFRKSHLVIEEFWNSLEYL